MNVIDLQRNSKPVKNNSMIYYFTVHRSYNVCHGVQSLKTLKLRELACPDLMLQTAVSTGMLDFTVKIIVIAYFF